MRFIIYALCVFAASSGEKPALAQTHPETGTPFLSTFLAKDYAVELFVTLRKSLIFLEFYSTFHSVFSAHAEEFVR